MTWSALVPAAIGATLTAALAALGWLLRRRFSDAPAKERADLYIQLTELSAKLRGGGISIADVRALEADMFARSGRTSEALSSDDSNDRLPPSYWSTAQMKARASARLAVLDNQVEELLVEYRGILPSERMELLTASYEAWYTYRQAEAALVGSQFEGGTFQPLAGTYAAISLSEPYIDRLRKDLSALKSGMV